MKKTVAVVALIAGLLAAPRLANAHHGWAAFESVTKVTLKGTVTDFHFVNPHSVIEFSVKDDKGQIQAWEGEMTSPLHLAPLGWSAGSLEPGEQITITGFPAKNGSFALRVTRIVQANGKEMKMTLKGN
jgi:hypothetical protein